MGQTVIVSGAAAGLAQILHHPLFTLKSQMMYHGKKFNFREFLHRGFVKQPAGFQFLYRGEHSLGTRLQLYRVWHVLSCPIHNSSSLDRSTSTYVGSDAREGLQDDCMECYV